MVYRSHTTGSRKNRRNTSKRNNHLTAGLREDKINNGREQKPHQKYIVSTAEITVV